MLYYLTSFALKAETKREKERGKYEGRGWHVWRAALAGFFSRDTTLKVIKKFLKKFIPVRSNSHSVVAV